MNVSIFLPNKTDFTVMGPKLLQLETNGIESAYTLLKIQQVAGLYPADYIKSFLTLVTEIDEVHFKTAFAAGTWSCALDYFSVYG